MGVDKMRGRGEEGDPVGSPKVDLSNRPGRPFWLMAWPKKRWAGSARPSTVAGQE